MGQPPPPKGERFSLSQFLAAASLLPSPKAGCCPSRRLKFAAIAQGKLPLVAVGPVKVLLDLIWCCRSHCRPTLAAVMVLMAKGLLRPDLLLPKGGCSDQQLVAVSPEEQQVVATAGHRFCDVGLFASAECPVVYQPFSGHQQSCSGKQWLLLEFLPSQNLLPFLVSGIFASERRQQRLLSPVDLCCLVAICLRVQIGP